MHAFVEISLSNALMAIPLAALAYTVGIISRRPALEHALWVLVLVKLVTPPLYRIELPNAFSLPATSTSSVIPARTEPMTMVSPEEVMASFPILSGEVLLVDDETPNPEANEPLRAPAVPLVAEPPSRERPTPTQPAAVMATAARSSSTNLDEVTSQDQQSGRAGFPTWLNGFTILLSVWVGIAVMKLVRDLAAIARFHGLLVHAVPSCSQLQACADRIASQYGLASAPRVTLLPGVISPMIWPVGRRARLLMPEALLDQLDSKQVETLLAHELAHLRRRDHWVRLLELIVHALYWWHPVVWWGRRRMRGLEEEACDAWVTWSHPTHAKTYANALLSTLDFLSETHPILPPAASGVGHMTFLKRRLSMIMHGNKPKSLTRAGWTIIALGGLVLLPWTPTLAWEEHDSTSGEAREQQARRDREQVDSHELLGRIGQLLVDGRLDEARRLAERVRRQQSREGRDRQHEQARESIRERSERSRAEQARHRHEQLEHRHRRNNARRGDERRPRYDELQPDLGDLQDEIAEEIQGGIRELQQELEDAAEEIRDEVMDAFEEMPAELMGQLKDLDLEDLLGEAAEDMPRSLRTFLNGVDLENILEQAMDGVEVDDVDGHAEVDPERMEAIRRDWNEGWRDQLGRLQQDFEEALAEVREDVQEAMQDAPREVLRALEDMDVGRLVEEALQDAPPALQEFLEEVDVEEVVDGALKGLRGTADHLQEEAQFETLRKRAEEQAERALQQSRRAHQQALENSRRAVEEAARIADRRKREEAEEIAQLRRMADRNRGDLERRLSRLEVQLEKLLAQLDDMRDKDRERSDEESDFDDFGEVDEDESGEQEDEFDFDDFGEADEDERSEEEDEFEEF